MKCLNCSSQTTNPKYCSRSCSATINNNKFPKRKPERVCSKCPNKIAHYRTLFCNAHLQEWKNRLSINYKTKTIGEYRNLLSVKGKHPSWASSHIRLFNRRWNKEMRNLPCANCNYSKYVELCHKIPVSSFPDSTLLKEVNSPNNVIQLCPNCHWEFDNGILTL